MGSIAEREGMSIARSMPVVIDRASMCHGCIIFMAISPPVKRVTSPNISLVTRTSRNLFTLSAITPPQTENSRTGRRLAVVVNPTMNGELVRSCISQSLP